MVMIAPQAPTDNISPIKRGRGRQFGPQPRSVSDGVVDQAFVVVDECRLTGDELASAAELDIHSDQHICDAIAELQRIRAEAAALGLMSIYHHAAAAMRYLREAQVLDDAEEIHWQHEAPEHVVAAADAGRQIIRMTDAPSGAEIAPIVA